MENIDIIEHRCLDEEYPRCGHVDCVFIDCPLSKGPCLFCVEFDKEDEQGAGL